MVFEIGYNPKYAERFIEFCVNYVPANIYFHAKAANIQIFLIEFPSDMDEEEANKWYDTIQFVVEHDR